MDVFVFAQSVQKKANICSHKQWRTEAWSIEEGEKGGRGGRGGSVNSLVSGQRQLRHVTLFKLVNTTEISIG